MGDRSFGRKIPCISLPTYDFILEVFLAAKKYYRRNFQKVYNKWFLREYAYLNLLNSETLLLIITFLLQKQKLSDFVPNEVKKLNMYFINAKNVTEGTMPPPCSQ